MYKRKNNYKWLLITLLLITVIFAAGTFLGYNLIFKSNFRTPNNEKCLIFIRENNNFNDILDTLSAKGYLKNRKNLENYAKMRNLEKKLKVGCYTIKSGMTNRDFFNIVCNGLQTPVNLKLNNIRFNRQLASKISKQVNIDSVEMLNLLNDNEFLKKYSVTPQTVISLFIPNTYEVYWTISAEQLLERMEKEYKKFWNSERLKKAAEIPLTPIETAILASIVEEETNKKYEKPIIAGLYINRLQRGMKLQACPTARYASGDFTITQVLDYHTNINSPYNTYKYVGLPPGPIRMPSIEGIDAVLNYSRHNYIFMCAKPELNGENNFSATLAEHNRNTNAYYKAYKIWEKNRQ
jgi:UPF0755 protein